MATLAEQFLAATDTQAAPAQPQPREDVAARFLQATSEMGNTSRVNAPPNMQREPPPGIERFAREGVPLDVTQGAPFWKRAGLSFQPTDSERLDYLSRAYQGAQVDEADGNFIIRNVQGADGKTKDLLVDEQDIGWGDIADLADVAPQIAAEALLFKGARAIPAFAEKLATMGRGARVMTESGMSTAASQSAAAAGDAFSRVGEQAPAGDSILQRRFASAEPVTSFALGAGLGGSLESLAGARDISQGRLTGLLQPSDPERQGITALANIERESGVSIKPSIAQMAADPNALRLESLVGKLPIIGRAIERARLERNAKVRELQVKMMDGTPYTPLTELGSEVADTVRAAIREPQAAAQFAETSLANRAADELETAITKMAPAAIRLTPEVTTDLSKFAVLGRHNEFRGKADELFSAAGNPDIPTAPLDNLLKKVEEKLPKEKIEVGPDDTLESLVDQFGEDVQAFILDASGKPVVSEAGQRINRDLVPASLTKLIRGLRRLGDSVPLEQIRTVRNTIDNAIHEGRGLEGIDTFQLKQVAHALTETLEKGVETLPDQVAANALKRANAFYKENVEQFETPIIARMLKTKPAQPGYIGGFGLMDHIRANPDDFRHIERFMKGSLTEGGKAVGSTANPTFNSLRRSVMEDIYRRASTSPGAGRYIDADAFLDDLGKFKPELQSVLLGVEEPVMRRNLSLLKQLKQGFKDVPVDDLNAFMRNPNNSVHDLSRLATARQGERKLFENEVVQKLFKGEQVELLDGKNIKADQALDWMLNAKNESDVTMFMSLLGDNPEVVKRLRANAVADFFQEVAQRARPEEAGLRDTTHLVDPQKIITALRDPEKSRRLRIILGQQKFQMLDWFATAQSLLGKRASQTLVGSNIGIQMLQDMSVLVRNLPDTMKFFLYSRILTDDTLNKLIQRGATQPATNVRNLTSALIMSPPLLNALAEEFGQTGLEMVLQNVQSVLGGVRNEEGMQRRGTAASMNAGATR